MAAPAEVEATVAVALLGCADPAREQLRRALLECGAELVFEADPRETDPESLKGSHPAVVIVNLDSSIEDAVDALQPVLEDPAINVVFNDSEVTRQLEGWDLARWARHLAAKVLGHADVNPPAPSTAEWVPMRDLQPGPGAPPTPAQQAGERAIEEFEIEAEEVADSVPIDYMPMPETPDGRPVETGAGESLDMDLSGLEDAMGEAGRKPELAPRAVPGVPEAGHDAESVMPPLDLDALEAALQAGAPEPVEAAPSSAEVEAPAAAEPDTPADDEDMIEAALEHFDLDADAPEDFSHFSQEDPGTQLDADLDALSETLDRGLSGAEDGDGVVDLQFGEDDPAISGPGPGVGAEPAPVAKDAGGSGLDFSSLELTPMDEEDESDAPVAAAAADIDFGSLNLSLEPVEGEAAAKPETGAGTIDRVIVLGASIGGPDALRGFLAGIPEDFPAVFLLAQHLDNGFFERLAAQLQKAARLPVRVPGDSHRARRGEVLVIPGDETVSLAADGTVTRVPCAEPPRYRPCIDEVLRMAADGFGANATAIIFSGMAGDAVEGSVYLASKGGEVWAQTPDSCVVSSMVDGACSRGVVEFIGTPRELADYCVHRFGDAG
ncbi:MAG TPA: chemotaxis protein CheB [Xanthomonadaceae bacterium]|nr:chemotaxis protein CheB [Xanthomonadaceae bacterium]